jgi:hypothetical protein
LGESGGILTQPGAAAVAGLAATWGLAGAAV